MGFFDFIEESWDEISGKKAERERRWKRQTRVDARENRKDLILVADEIIKLKNEKIRSISYEIDQDVSNISDYISILSSLAEKLGMEEEGDRYNLLSLSLLARSLSFKIGFEPVNIFDLFSDVDELMDIIHYKFYYSNGHYYVGNEDEFVDYIDNLMSEYLENDLVFSKKWLRAVKKIREVRI